MWEETVVLNFQEAMLPQFYNDRGQPLGTIQYDVDSAGRQFILFHLKTVAAHKKAPEAGIFSNSSRTLKKNRNSMDVDTDDDDDDDDDDDEQEEEQDDEEEYFSPRNDSKRPSGFDDDKLKNFAHQMLAEVQEMMVQSQTNQRAETEQLLQQYTGQQMFAQGPPVPDGHPSSWMESPSIDSMLYVDNEREKCEEEWIPPSLVELGEDINSGWAFLASLKY